MPLYIIIIPYNDFYRIADSKLFDSVLLSWSREDHCLLSVLFTHHCQTAPCQCLSLVSTLSAEGILCLGSSESHYLFLQDRVISLAYWSNTCNYTALLETFFLLHLFSSDYLKTMRWKKGRLKNQCRKKEAIEQYEKYWGRSGVFYPGASFLEPLEPLLLF